MLKMPRVELAISTCRLCKVHVWRLPSLRVVFLFLSRCKVTTLSEGADSLCPPLPFMTEYVSFWQARGEKNLSKTLAYVNYFYYLCTIIESQMFNV